MDEYLSEKEQIERLRQWWRENGWFLLGGAALGALLLFGYNQYRDYQDRQAEAAAEVYASLRELADGTDVAAAAALVSRLREEFPDSAYTDQAGLLLAKMQLVTAPERATEELRYVMENTDERELALIARSRLARVLAYREQHEEALQLLEVQDPGQFAAIFDEIEGDIHATLGRHAEARSAYLAALTAPGAEVLDRNFLQMKLNDLPSQVAREASSGAAPAPASSAEVQPPAAESAAPAASDAPPAADAAGEPPSEPAPGTAEEGA